MQPGAPWPQRISHAKGRYGWVVLAEMPDRFLAATNLSPRTRGQGPSAWRRWEVDQAVRTIPLDPARARRALAETATPRMPQ